MARIAHALAALAVAAATLLTGCGDGSDPPSDVSDPPSGGTSTLTTEPTPAPTPEGEIWQWALGRDLFDDPDLAAYTADLGTEEGTDVFVYGEGFELTGDEYARVAAVTLFNDETALGFPVSDTSMSAYQGTLPLGMTWSTTATDLGLADDPAVVCVAGLECTFDFIADDGHAVTLTFAASSREELPMSVLHSVKVS